MIGRPHLCDAFGTITQAELDKKRSEVCAISFVYSRGRSHLIFTLRCAPSRPLYLVTRRDRTRPKVFKDQNRVIAMLRRRFNELVFVGSPNYAERSQFDEQ